MHAHEWGAATASPQKRRLPVADLRAAAEPPGRVQAECVGRGEGAQVVLEPGEVCAPDPLGPLLPQLAEDHSGAGQAVVGAGGQPDRGPAGVGRVRGPFDVAQPLEPVDRLAGGLLRDPEPAPQLRRGGTSGPIACSTNPCSGRTSGCPCRASSSCSSSTRSRNPSSSRRASSWPGISVDTIDNQVHH